MMVLGKGFFEELRLSSMVNILCFMLLLFFNFVGILMHVQSAFCFVFWAWIVMESVEESSLVKVYALQIYLWYFGHA